MNILYISSTHAGMHEKSIYYDLVQEFVRHGHNVTIVYAREKRLGMQTDCYVFNNVKYLGVKTGNMTKNKNLIDKGISLLTVDSLFTKAYNKFLKDDTIDLVLYSTPPITFIKTLKYIKKRSPQVFLYLMLKDIFPQNAVDISMMRENGIIHKFFKAKEKNYIKLLII